MSRNPAHALIFGLSLFIGSFLSASSQAGAQEGQFHPKRVFVKTYSKTQSFSHSSVESVKEFFPGLYVVETNNMDGLVRDLSQSPDIEYVERDAINKKQIRAQLVPTPRIEKKSRLSMSFNDPRVGSQWAFRTASRHGMTVTNAYDQGLSQPLEKVIVAVVDTGVDYNHPDLKNVMWKNTAEIPGNKIDDDGNGYVDDVYGIDTLDRDKSGHATGDPMDTHNHGTHVAGIIGAEQNNGIGVAGVSSSVQIMAIRTVPNSGDETDVDVVESFMYAAKMGAKIINCSFGKSRNEGGMAVRDAINHIGQNYGTLVIAASGNETSDIDRVRTYPASFDSATLLVIASTTSRGGLSYFSNYGLKNVDLASPGSGILSTVRNNGYASYSGTSMASPNAAGVAAELLANRPDLSPAELKYVLMKSVSKVNSFKTKMITGGRIDLRKGLLNL